MPRARSRAGAQKTRRQRQLGRAATRMKKSLKRLHKQLGGLGRQKYLMIKQRANECYVDTLILALLHYKNPEIIADFVEGAGPLEGEMRGFLKSLSATAKTLGVREKEDCVLMETFRRKVAELSTNEELQPFYPPRTKLPRYDFSQPITLLNALYEIMEVEPAIQGERTDVNLVRYFLESAEGFEEMAAEYATALRTDDYGTLDRITDQIIEFVSLEISALQEDPEETGLVTTADLDELPDILNVPYRVSYPYEEQAISITNIYKECVSDALKMLKGDGVSAAIVKGGRTFDRHDDSRPRALLVHKDISSLKSYVFVSVERQPGAEEHFKHVEIPVMFTSEISAGDGVRIFFLVSMICYTDNHFVCFVKADGGEDNWYLFDDMQSATKRYTEIGSFSDVLLHPIKILEEVKGKINTKIVLPSERAVFLVYSEANFEEEEESEVETNVEGSNEPESVELAKTSKTLRAARAKATENENAAFQAALEASMTAVPEEENADLAAAIAESLRGR